MRLDNLVLLASVAAILGAIVYSINSPFPTTHFTEFYLHPNSTNFTYGMTNYEGKYVTYEVEGYFIKNETGDRVPLFSETVGLADKETFTSQIIDKPSQGGIVILELYRKDLSQSGPYRTLHFGISRSKGGSDAG